MMRLTARGTIAVMLILSLLTGGIGYVAGGFTASKVAVTPDPSQVGNVLTTGYVNATSQLKTPQILLGGVDITTLILTPIQTNGVATILSGTTSITVIHGLSYTPNATNTKWIVTYLENPTNDPGSWYLVSENAVNATLGVFREPGISNLDIAWSAEKIQP